MVPERIAPWSAWTYTVSRMFKQIARFCLYATPFALVVVLPSTFFPFIGGKYFLFRTLVAFAASATLLGWAFENEPLSLKERFWPALRSPVGIGFTFLTAAILLATAFAYDPIGAFWSNFERGEGAFQFLHYFAFFVLMGGLFTERKHWKTMLWCSVVAAGGVALYGVLSAVSPTAFLGPYGSTEGSFLQKVFSANRFQGSFGNAAYVTPYFLFVAAYVLWLWGSATTRLKAGTFALAGIVLSLAFFVLSGTRGAFLGFVAGTGIAALYVAWKSRRARRWVLGALALGIVAFAGLFVMRNDPRVAALPGARFLQLDFGQTTAQTRFWTWNTAFKGFKDRPVLGYGPENFPVVFDKHFDPRHFDPVRGGETWFDRAHNIVLDYAATTGAVGVIAWLSFIVLLFVQVARAIRQHSLSLLEEAILIGLPVMYVVQAMFLFDVLPIMLNLLIVAGLALAATHWRPRGNHTVITPKNHVRAH